MYAKRWKCGEKRERRRRGGGRRKRKRMILGGSVFSRIRYIYAATIVCSPDLRAVNGRFAIFAHKKRLFIISESAPITRRVVDQEKKKQKKKRKRKRRKRPSSLGLWCARPPAIMTSFFSPGFFFLSFLSFSFLFFFTIFCASAAAIRTLCRFCSSLTSAAEIKSRGASKNEDDRYLME